MDLSRELSWYLNLLEVVEVVAVVVFCYHPCRIRMCYVSLVAAGAFPFPFPCPFPCS